MKIYGFPYYCGAKILIGLYNPIPEYKDKPGSIYKVAITHYKEHGVEHRGTTVIDPVPYVPSTLLEFQQILKTFFHVEMGKEAGLQGVIYAVTNSSQKLAANYLKETGFKEVGRFAKHSRLLDCINWYGDYRHDLYPILSKVPNFGEKNASKFAPTKN